MTSHVKFAVVVSVLTLIVVACGAAPTATPTTAPRAVPTATPALVSQPTVAPTATAMIAATATKAPAAAPTATLAPVATRPPAATQATEQAPAGNTPDVIANAQRAVLKQKAFRSRIKITSETGTVTDMIGEYVLPDRVHMTISGIETIAIKNIGFWRKEAGGQWQSMPAAMAASDAIFAALDPKQVDTLVQGIVISSFKSVGVELLDGKPMRTYEYSATANLSGLTIDSTNKIWIGVADGLPYRVDTNSTMSGALASKSQTTNLYEYDNTIKIDAPM